MFIDPSAAEVRDMLVKDFSESFLENLISFFIESIVQKVFELGNCAMTPFLNEFLRKQQQHASNWRERMGKKKHKLEIDDRSTHYFKLNSL